MAQVTTHAARSTGTAGRTAVVARLAILDRQSAAAAGLGACLVLSVGLSDGGYYGRVSTALTGAFAAIAALGAIHGIRPTRAGMATLVVLLSLVGWTALSSTWAVPGSLVDQDVRRTLVYACALAAVLFVVDARRREALMLGLLGGISLLGILALGMRVASGEVRDRFYGTLLEEPVGYPNALGVLAAFGIVLATGLARPGLPDRALRSAATLLVLVLGMSGSRGAALALVVGLCVLVALSPAGERLEASFRVLTTCFVGSAAWAVAVWANAGGVGLAVIGLGSLVAGALVPVPRGVPRRMLPALAAGLLVAVVGIAALQPISTTSSFRTAYWSAALEEARARPALGSGAGSFHLTWTERGEEGMFVRDAHSLYFEVLAELGPLGLALVLSVVAVPIGGAVRRRGDPLAAVAGAAFVVFVVHSGLDWDWEMPVVTLAALGCAGAALAHPSTAHQGGKP